MVSHPYGPTIYLPVPTNKFSEEAMPLDGEMHPMEVLAFLTWSWVLEILAGAVLSWLGKLALDSLFAGPNGSGGITPQQFYELLQKTMREALSEFDIQKMTRHYQAVVEGMLEFKTTGGIHRLDDADTAVNELILGFQAYGDITADLLASAELLKIAIYQTYTNERIRDETENIRRRAPVFKIDLTQAAQTRLKLINGYYWGPTIKYPGHGEMAEYGFTYKGEFAPVEACWPNDAKCTTEAWPKAQSALTRVQNAEIEQRYNPFLKAIDVLDKVLSHHKH